MKLNFKARTGKHRAHTFPVLVSNMESFIATYIILCFGTSQ